MTNEEAKAREIKLKEIKDQIATRESELQNLWLELIELRLQIRAAQQTEDGE